ncbi:unnamed protein product, partial [Lymnaea stagnalis]
MMAGNTTICLSPDPGALHEMEYLAAQIKEEPLESWIIKEDGLGLLTVDEELQAVKAELMEAEPDMLQHLKFLDQSQDLPVTVHCQVDLNKLNEQDLNTTPPKESFEKIVFTQKKPADDCLQKNLPTSSDLDKEDRAKNKKGQKHPKNRKRARRYPKRLIRNVHVNKSADNRGNQRTGTCGEKSTGTLYSCSLCNCSRIKTFKDLKKHIKNHIVGSFYECQLCSFSTRKHVSLQRHYLSGHSHLDHVSNRIHCLLCPYNCMRSKTIRSHLFLAHLNRAKFQCSLCGYKTNCKYRLDEHNAVHKSERPYACPHSNCSFSSRHKPYIAKHVKKIHAKEKVCKVCHPFSCDLCGAGFLAKAKFKRHLLIHDSFKRYSCNQCDYSTNRSDTLKGHMLTHSTVRKYHCHICKVMFKSVRSLKCHIKKHSRLDTFLCPLSSLLIPKSMDHYVCLICGFMTKSLGSLSQHKLVHEEKQYLCDFCAFRCGRKYNLQLHMLTHFKDRPFKCHLCSFASKSPS